MSKRKVKVTVKRRDPLIGITIAIMLGFIVASAFGCTPEWLK